MPESGSTLPRRQLGRYLRNGREECGFSLAQASKLVQRSSSWLQRIEKGQTGTVRRVDIDWLCKIYGFDAEMTAAMQGLAAQANVQNWWHEYGDLIPPDFDVFVGLEQAAVHLTTYQAELIPGLLQTPGYASTLIRSVYPDETKEEHERRVQLRLRRQARITRRRQPNTMEVVLRESVLRGFVGSPKVMATQLKHLADISTRANISIRVLPYRAGFPLGVAAGPFVIFGFDVNSKGAPEEPPVVYVECFAGDLYLQKPGVVRRYHQAYKGILRHAIDEVGSRSLIRQIAKEFS